jgi:uncharacterized ion transporter superfamily protein YfcC
MFSYIHFAVIAFLLCIQYIREYTSKVDDLVKDRIESQKEEEAKEQEQKDVVAQQVIWSTIPFLCYILLFIILKEPA